ncbi:MAG: NADH-quinone oxidoreductase subunit NuoE [Armatimonadota bacterium]|nr:NADH-quinone oxidoreductase subunit NuoE [Armatimonadota bacterium]
MGVTPQVPILSEEIKRKIAELAIRYDNPQSAVMPALYAAQEQIGYLPEEAVAEVADALSLPHSEVGAVASFYTMFYKKPVGEHVISICATLSCALLGADSLMEYLSEKLDIKVGETTTDGKFSLHAVECLGNCAEAPAMMLDDKYYGNLTREKLDRILSDLGWTEPGE